MRDAQYTVGARFAAKKVDVDSRSITLGIWVCKCSNDRDTLVEDAPHNDSPPCLHRTLAVT